MTINTPQNQPEWLSKAWRIRAVMLTIVIGLLGLSLTPAALERGIWAMPIFIIGLIAFAIWADWGWLKRNHHRVNQWGFSKGKNARRKPK